MANQLLNNIAPSAAGVLTGGGTLIRAVVFPIADEVVGATTK